MNITIEQAIKTLNKALRDDPEYRISWQANIAMSFVDVYDYHDGSTDRIEMANEAANNFLNLLSEDDKKLEY